MADWFIWLQLTQYPFAVSVHFSAFVIVLLLPWKPTVNVELLYGRRLGPCNILHACTLKEVHGGWGEEITLVFYNNHFLGSIYCVKRWNGTLLEMGRYSFSLHVSWMLYHVCSSCNFADGSVYIILCFYWTLIFVIAGYVKNIPLSSVFLLPLYILIILNWS